MIGKSVKVLFLLTSLLVSNINAKLNPVVNYCPFGEKSVMDYYKNGKRVGGKSSIKCSNSGFLMDLESKNDFVLDEFLADFHDNSSFLPDNDLLWNNLPYLGNSKCINNDKVLTISMGVIVGNELYKSLDKSVSKTTLYIETLWKKVNYYYVNQFGVHIVINHLIIEQDSKGKFSNPSCKMDIFDDFTNVLDNFQYPSEQAMWHKISYCPDDTARAVGLGQVGLGGCKGGGTRAISNIGRSTFVTVAHEIGHNMGAGHHTTGGIMSTGSKSLNGLIQFNIESKSSICSNVKRIEACNNPNKAYYISSDSCGNGIIEAGEECECPSGKTCSCCKNCKLVSECSPFQNECCSSNCKFLDTSSECSSLGKRGYCRSGYCESPSFCNLVATKPSEGFCGLHKDNVCKISCEYKGSCITMNGWTAAGKPMNWAADGSLCSTSSIIIGACKNGECISVGPQIPTLKPTPKPIPNPTKPNEISYFDKKKVPEELCGGVWEDIFNGVNLQVNCKKDYRYSSKYAKKLSKFFKPLSSEVAKIPGMGDSKMELSFNFIDKNGNEVEVDDLRLQIFALNKDESVELFSGQVETQGNDISKEGNVYTGIENKERKVKNLRKSSTKTESQTLIVNFGSSSEFDLTFNFVGKDSKIYYQYFTLSGKV